MIYVMLPFSETTQLNAYIIYEWSLIEMGKPILQYHGSGICITLIIVVGNDFIDRLIVILIDFSK